MAAGKAIVSTAVDGCREVLEDGAHRPAGSAPGPGRPRRGPRRAARRSRPPRERSGRSGARGLAPATTSRPCVAAMEALYDEVLAADGREGRVALERHGRRRVGGLRGPARPAARPLPRLRHRAARSPGATCPSSCSTAWSPSPSGASCATSPTTATSRSRSTSTSRASWARARRPSARCSSPSTTAAAASGASGGPLLRRYGMKGVVFLVPGRMPSRPGPLPPTLGRRRRRDARRPSAVLAREAGDGAFLSWEEIDALLARGPLRVPEPHPHPRARSTRRRASPASLRPSCATATRPWTCRSSHDGGRDLPGRRGAAGHAAPRARRRAPPRRCASTRTRTSARPAWRRRARRGEGFFERRDWEARLRRLVAGAPARGAARERPRSASRRIRARARRGAQAPSRSARAGPPSTSAIPGTSSGPTARRLAREAGYRHRVLRQGAGACRITLPGGDPLRIARIGEDYVELLPAADARTS